jgi:phage portal protein BeeE
LRGPPASAGARAHVLQENEQLKEQLKGQTILLRICLSPQNQMEGIDQDISWTINISEGGLVPLEL